MGLSECSDPLNRFLPLGVPECATLKSLIDERFDFGFGDLNGHDNDSFFIMTH
jgi:hypothetical protein